MLWKCIMQKPKNHLTAVLSLKWLGQVLSEVWPTRICHGWVGHLVQGRECTSITPCLTPMCANVHEWLIQMLAAYWARSRKLWNERRRPPLASHPRRLLMMMDDDDDGSSVSPILWLWLEEEEDGSVRTCRGSYAITSLIVSSAPKLFVKICIFRKQFSQTA